MQRPAFLFLLSFWFSLSLQAQQTNWRIGELLVQLSDGTDIKNITSALQRSGAPSIATVRQVSETWRIYQMIFNATETSEASLIEAARRLPGVVAVQRNLAVEDRSVTPNDSLWSKQNNFVNLGLPDAWAISTGGLTPAGDTIVVAVLEKGAIMTHPDLRGNAWRNHAEIPGDGLDNDNNGYIDDYKGWNPRTRNDNSGERSSHGTSVNGIIGAVGNNTSGVTGINWKIKLMNLGNVQFEDEIIAAYEYVFKARKRYNQTKGAQGAFVVATNASFGLNDERSSDHLIWCAMYDSLGSVGVLTAGATTNRNVDVDQVGDMPTTCPSEYLIGVTNTDAQGVKVTAGFGTQSIDLGAPGERAWTTNYTSPTVSTYGEFAGTSSATPMVTGAIALLYSYDCTTFTVDALTNPSACARRVRDAILKNVKPEPSLVNTVTKGLLHLEGPTNQIRILCDGSRGDLSLSVRPNPVTGMLFVDYETPNFEQYTFKVYNAQGQLMYEETVTPPQFGKKTYRYDTANLPKGFYFMTIQKDKKSESVKFVKN
jgi:serine protease